MSKPSTYEGTRTEIALAQAVAEQRKKEGWTVVREGDIAKLRAAEGDDALARYDLASFPTAVLYHKHDGPYKGIGFEVWRRPKVDRSLGLVPADQVDLLGAQS